MVYMGLIDIIVSHNVKKQVTHWHSTQARSFCFSLQNHAHWGVMHDYSCSTNGVPLPRLQCIFLKAVIDNIGLDPSRQQNMITTWNDQRRFLFSNIPVHRQQKVTHFHLFWMKPETIFRQLVSLLLTTRLWYGPGWRYCRDDDTEYNYEDHIDIAQETHTQEETSYIFRCKSQEWSRVETD